MGRLLLVVVAVIAIGFVGGLIVQGITPPSERYVEREPGKECIYNAASAEAGALAAQPEGGQPPSPASKYHGAAGRRGFRAVVHSQYQHVRLGRSRAVPLD